MMSHNVLQFYKSTDSYKKSSYGFDKRAFDGFKECYTRWVVPLSSEVTQLRLENTRLRDQIEKLTSGDVLVMSKN